MEGDESSIVEIDQTPGGDSAEAQTGPDSPQVQHEPEQIDQGQDAEEFDEQSEQNADQSYSRPPQSSGNDIPQAFLDSINQYAEEQQYQEQQQQQYYPPSSGYMRSVTPLDGDGNEFVLQIEVIRELRKKPFLGGYRSKKTGLEYHHASVQTDMLPHQRKALEDKYAKVLFHRETQTVEVKSGFLQPTREQGTQMARAGVHLDESGDRVVQALPYFEADRLLALRLEKAIIIQSHARAWFARREAYRLRQKAYDEYVARVRAEQERKQQSEERKRREIARRMHPRTREDFDILYSELEAWRLSETKRIKESGVDEEEQRAALSDLLRKETKLLQTIDRLKIAAGKENRERQIMSTMDRMASASKLLCSDGKITLVTTPYTERAAQLRDLYNGLCAFSIPADRRLMLLANVKYTVKEFDCLLTREIVELIDRETDLLSRGRTEKSLEGLRRRISSLFLRFCETPEFNPSSRKFVPSFFDFLNRPEITAPVDKK